MNPIVPPPWITLASASDWLDRSFGLRGATVFRKLALAIREGAIKHVVVNLAFGSELSGVHGPRPKGARLRGAEGMSVAQVIRARGQTFRERGEVDDRRPTIAIVSGSRLRSGPA